MPIRVFPPHYQLVYISFDISSFSLISYIVKGHLLQVNQAPFRSQKSMCQLWLHENCLQTPMIWE